MKLMPQSPSSIGTFNTCPKMYEAKYVTKIIKFQPNEANMRGDRWHNFLEDRMADHIPLPPEVAHFEPMMQRFERFRGEIKTEFKIAVNADFQPCDYRQRYIGGKVDLAIVNPETRHAVVFDYKTGKAKYNDEFALQIQFYAVAMLVCFPHLQSVRCAYLFLDAGRIEPRGDNGKFGALYTREDLPELQSIIRHNVEQIRSATERNEWLPRPGGLCRPNKPSVNGGQPWCQVRTCPFWNKR